MPRNKKNIRRRVAKTQGRAASTRRPTKASDKPASISLIYTRMPRGVYIQRKIGTENTVKRAIASHIASTYVRDFDAVLLDAGSTAEMVAEEVFAMRKFLSVLTNNMGAYAAYTRARATKMDDTGGEDRFIDQGVGGSLNGNELLVTGGRYVDIYESLLGQGATTTIEPFTPNVIVVGISGLRYEEGVFCHGAEEAEVKKLLCSKRTDIRLFAADWTKIGRRDAHAFGKVDRLRTNAREVVLVTCNPPKSLQPKDLESFEEQLKQIEAAGITVDRVKISETPS